MIIYGKTKYRRHRYEAINASSLYPWADCINSDYFNNDHFSSDYANSDKDGVSSSYPAYSIEY